MKHIDIALSDRLKWPRGPFQRPPCHLDVTEPRRELAGLLGADRRKNEFLATVCHELRTPLMTILQTVQVLEDAGDGDRSDHRWRRVIERQANHMKRLISDLLDASQAGSGRFDLDARRVLLGPILVRSVERVQPMLKEQAQHLQLCVPDDPVWLKADATRLEQVICNLLTNASKYSDRGTSIRLVAEAGDAGAMIRVADQGIGIPRELRQDIFKMFNQGRRPPHRAKGGLGIGLALVKQLVTLHGGTVEAHSEGLDRGSEFVVRFPCVAAPGEASEPGEPKTHAREPGQADVQAIGMGDTRREARASDLEDVA